MLPRWTRCRDCYEGSDAVKAKKTTYLPEVDIQTQTTAQYNAYLFRAMFYPATGRTIVGLVGAVFQKEISADAPPGIDDHLGNITKAGETLEVFAYQIMTEDLMTGRYGILIDMAAEGGQPYWLRYRAEDILSVRRERISGVETLSRVVLQEIISEQDPEDEFVDPQIKQIRVLDLVDGAYRVRLYREKEEGSVEYEPYMPEGQDRHDNVPQRRGESLPFIPFVLPDDKKPPLLDLVDVNLSHYLNKADHEHALHWVGNPFLWGRGLMAAQGEDIKSGPSTMIEVGEGGCIEMIQASGDALGALVAAMDRKEKTMAMLGARLLEDQPSTQETAEAVRMRHSGEHASLRAEAGCVEADLSRALQMHAWWFGTEADPDPSKVKASVELNKDFLNIRMSAEELKALVMGWQAEGYSYETLHDNLVRGGVMRPGVTAEEEQKAIQMEGGAPDLDATGVPVRGEQR